MRLKIVAILALLALIGAGSGRALASVNGPAQGEPAAVYDLEGNEVATFTVTDLQDPFEELSEFFEPDEGTRIVLAEIEVENTGERPFEFSQYDLFVRDTLGRTYGSTFVSASDDFEENNPELEGSNMGSGDTLSGVLYFVVLEDAELSDVLFQSNANDISVLVSIADLTPSEGAASGGDDAPADDDNHGSADDNDGGSDGSESGDDSDDAEATPES